MAAADRAERHFRAMGGEAAVTIRGHDAARLAAVAQRRVADLERRWSRFLPDSEISQLNRADGAPVAVSWETYVLVERAVEGWAATNGGFDPTVLPALTALGYDRSFESVAESATDDRGPVNPAPARSPGLTGVTLDPTVESVRLPRGVTFDPGGIGKGLAADLVAEEARALGATSVVVNLGGDLRVASWPEDGPVTVVVESPFDSRVELARMCASDGGIATSSPMARRWVHRGRSVHHLIDPATGTPLEGELAAITVVAGEAWWAEVVAKAALLEGAADALALITRAGATGLVIDAHGCRHDAQGLTEFLLEGAPA